jgi:uncharacterized membrane protein
MASAFHVYFGPEALTAPIVVRKIGPHDCFAALREGLDDFVAMPTHAAFLGLSYALGGIALAALSSFGNALHLVFPFAAGFALIGPFFAVGLYELSRKRESGLPASLRDAFAVFRSPTLPSIIALGLYLFAIFALWIGVAELLYVQIYGPNPPAAAVPFLDDVLTSGRGWLLIVLGGLVGLLCGGGALHQRHLLSAYARPRRRPRSGGRRFEAARPRESRSNRAVGPHRRGGACCWLAAPLPRSCPCHAGARPRHMAALSPGGPARSRA